MTRTQDLPLSERLRANTRINEGTGCWEWQKCRDPNGYGRISVKRKMLLPHRVSYEVHRGPIPADTFVLHRCDNPCCLNPDHLFLGDQAANMADKAAKGRSVFPLKRGADNGWSKLTDADVLAIRAAEGIPQRKLAKQFGVSQLHISRIRRGIVWPHISNGQNVIQPSQSLRAFAAEVGVNYKTLHRRLKVKGETPEAAAAWLLAKRQNSEFR